MAAPGNISIETIIIECFQIATNFYIILLYLFLQKRTKTSEEIDIYYLRLPVLLEDEWECFPANLSSTMVAAAAPPGHVCWHVMPRPHVRCRGATCPDVRTMVVMTRDLFDDH